MYQFIQKYVAISVTLAGLGMSACLLISGCAPGPKSSHGFTLPDGDAVRGQERFVALQCNACHNIGDIEKLPAPEGHETLDVRLGGEVPRIQTYGELVTGIINPSHRLATGQPAEEVATEEGESRMQSYNDTLTVTDLIDLVSFLQAHYELKIPEPTHYPEYMPY